MPITTNEEAQSLLLQVVEEWWSQTGRPLLGSQLKVRMLQRAPDFNEKHLQHKSFSAFVHSCKGIALEIRGTTDFAVVPAEHSQALTAPTKEQIKIRPAFWRAFVSFPKDNEIRAFVPDTGQIYIGPPASCPPSVFPIPSIPRES